MISLDVDFSARHIMLRPLWLDLPQSTIDHILLDQLVPRIRSHEGDLVAHAAALSVDNEALLILGASGRGKSTLAAVLKTLGCTLLGDDAVTLSRDENRIMARAIYPSLRLLPDSVEAIYGQGECTSPMAHYTTKLRVANETAARLASAMPVRCIFFLSAPSPDLKGIEIQSMNPAEVCMELIQESFALDPSDTTRAAQRLTFSSRMAECTVAFKLNYPRDYRQVAGVGRAVIQAAGSEHR